MDPTSKPEKTNTTRKYDRRMSPLNPSASSIYKDSDSAIRSDFDDDENLRKKTIGLSLRRIATERPGIEREALVNVTRSKYTEKKRYRENSEKMKSKASISKGAAATMRGDDSDLDDLFTQLLIESTSLPILPVWSQVVKGNTCNEQNQKPKLLQKLTKFNESFTDYDINSYIAEIEYSRNVKTFAWKKDPISIWPDWHENLQLNRNRDGSEGSSIASTTSLPLQCRNGPALVTSGTSMLIEDRSISPSIFGGYEEALMSDCSFTSPNTQPVVSKPTFSNKSFRHSARASFTSVPDTTEVKSFGTKHHSHGDLSEYLKGFSRLKKQLNWEHHALNMEIKKILEEIQSFINNTNGKQSGEITTHAQSQEPISTTSTISPHVFPATTTNSSVGHSVDKYSKLLKIDTSKKEKLPQKTKIHSAGPVLQSHPWPSPKNRKKNSMETIISSESLDEYRADLNPNFMNALLDVTEIAQNILDTNTTSLMAPSCVQNFTAELQRAQANWLQNSSWPFQDLIVRLLVGFSKIGRIMEHFEEDVRMWKNVSSAKNSLKSPRVTSSRTSMKKKNSMIGDSVQFISVDDSDYGNLAEFEDSDYPESPPRKSFSSNFWNKKWHGNEITVKSARDAFKAAVNEDHSVNVLFEIDQNGKISYCTSSVQKVFLFSPEEIVGSHDIPFLKSENKDVFAQAAKASIGEKSMQIKFEAITSDGKSIMMEGKGMFGLDNLGNHTGGAVWIIRPVKKISKESRASITDVNIHPDDESSGFEAEFAFCNICEVSVPTTNFQTHTTLCMKAHKSEMDLVLFNDNVKTHITDCELKLKLLREEIESANTHEPSDVEKIYIAHLRSLLRMGEEILDKLNIVYMNQLPRIKFPKTPLPFLDSTKHCYSCPKEEDFLPNDDISNEAFVDDGVITIGVSLHKLGMETETLMSTKNNLLRNYEENLVPYLSCLEKEQILMNEIEELLASPGTPNSFGSGSNADLKYEIKEIGGVLVKVPSLLNLKQGDDNKKESVFFASPPLTTTGTSFSDFPSSSVTTSAGPISRTSLGGASTFSEGPTTFQNRFVEKTPLKLNMDDISIYKPSVRSARIFVGDKTLEVETLSSPTAKSSSPYLNQPHRRGSMMMISAGGGSSMMNLPGSPVANNTGPSIKDYDIIKPISKGAFGSVYLAKKKISDQYYAIKILKKADMVAKNQTLNIKSERTILTQLDSPYVVKLYFSFQSKNHIYLVMEYLNGGDCASLLKSVQQLDEPWARQYISEVVEGLEFLHQRDIIHRDMKPDNMLIDINGHIKLTDFGLSKAGFIGRRALGVGDLGIKKLVTPKSANSSPSISDAAFPSSPQIPYFKNYVTRRDSVASVSSNDSFVLGSRLTEKLEEADRTLAGTPDYLAPESILGLTQGASVDWWAVGIILYEFLFGIPPFNAETPSEVFKKILTGKIDWNENDIEISNECQDLMENLLCQDIERRIGSNGAGEIKAHKWFENTNWESLMTQEVHFIPVVKNVEDTEYFDSKGMESQKQNYSDSSEKDSNEDVNKNDFGESILKNLPLLEKANQETVSKIRSETERRESIGIPYKSAISRVSTANLWMQKRRESLPTNSLLTSSIRKLGSPLIGDGEAKKLHERAYSGSRDLSPDRKNSQIYLENAKKTLFESFSTNPDESVLNYTKNVIIADSNPVSTKILETILNNLLCRSIVVRSGPEVIQHLMGDICYDILFIDFNLPTMNCEDVFRMIRDTKNANQSIPMVLLREENDDMGSFSMSLVRPFTKDSVVAVLEEME